MVPSFIWAMRLSGSAGDAQSSFDIGTAIIEGSGAARAHRLTFLTRLPFLAFPLLTVWLVWHWARELFSEGTALAVAFGVALEPTLSLLRLSALQRLMGAAVLAAVLWVVIAAVLR